MPHADRIQAICQFQFKVKDGSSACNTISDKSFMFTDRIFEKMFVSPAESARQEIVEKFGDDFDRLIDAKKPLATWSDDYYGRLAVVILADAVNFCIHNGEARAYEYNEDAKQISVSMATDEDLYNQYKMVEKLQLVKPLMHIEKIEH